MTAVSDADDSAPGWDAIDAALAARYGDQEPRHVGSGAPPPCPAPAGCSAYAADGHWHYVTYGLSELFEPIPEANPEVSGWGFELTMRVPRDGDEPPAWPFRMLDEIAQYVNDSRAVLAPGHRIDFRQPVTGHPEVEGAPPTRGSPSSPSPSTRSSARSTPRTAGGVPPGRRGDRGRGEAADGGRVHRRGARRPR